MMYALIGYVTTETYIHRHQLGTVLHYGKYDVIGNCTNLCHAQLYKLLALKNDKNCSE